jgi:predicted ATPase with chaperone activity
MSNLKWVFFVRRALNFVLFGADAKTVGKGLTPRLIRIRECPSLRGELRAYAFRKSPTGKNLIDHKQLQEALKRQKAIGGRIGEHLVTLGYLTQEQLQHVMQEPPAAPSSIAETGYDAQFLLKFILKSMFLSGSQTVPEIAREITLSRRIVEELLQGAKKEALVETRGALEANLALLRYALTTKGMERALEALQQSQYVGPIPVRLGDYRLQVQKQAVTNERVTNETLAQILAHLVLPQHILRQLGPAVNSGKPILLYGPSGNGKTSIAEAIGQAFEQTIYLPYCIEVGGHLIKIFDPVVHEEVESARSADAAPSGLTLPTIGFDPRWVRCRRPVIVAGGELTLDILDLKLDPISHDYEAPLQVKATGGVFVIDDFGRQLMRPQDLLNRWIIPLERKVDYLTLHTGKKFAVPFDELVIFSTNLSPEDLMDTAFLRRLPYKFLVGPPSQEHYEALFRRICASRGFSGNVDEILSYLSTVFYRKTKDEIAAFHPRFILDHVLAACEYESVPPQLTLDKVKDALRNLSIASASVVE